MTDKETVKATLRRLATTENDDQQAAPLQSVDAEHQTTIERATAALDDLDAAARFVDDGGLDRLQRAVEAAEQSVSACTEQGRETLAEYRRLQAALSGDHFHSGRGTSLGDDAEAESR